MRGLLYGICKSYHTVRTRTRIAASHAAQALGVPSPLSRTPYSDPSPRPQVLSEPLGISGNQKGTVQKEGRREQEVYS